MLTGLALGPGRAIVSASFNGLWVDPEDASQILAYPGNSLTLAPQFAGF